MSDIESNFIGRSRSNPALNGEALGSAFQDSSKKLRRNERSNERKPPSVSRCRWKMPRVVMCFFWREKKHGIMMDGFETILYLYVYTCIVSFDEFLHNTMFLFSFLMVFGSVPNLFLGTQVVSQLPGFFCPIFPRNIEIYKLERKRCERKISEGWISWRKSKRPSRSRAASGLWPAQLHP